MKSGDQRPGGSWLLPLFLAGSALTAIAAAVVALERVPPRRTPLPVPAPLPVLAVPAESIAGEAQVFRTSPATMAIAPATRREREAHPRTLATYRYLRAYPGAPPRVPHELTPEEFRAGTCNTCHERGGYSARFAAYVPLTPHPDRGPCLQCHLGTDTLMAVPLVSPDPNRRCHQCHAAGGTPRSERQASLDWITTGWPRLAQPAVGEQPPPILHAGEPRGNCLACHGGPGAVAEIRTSHPTWTDCRQCHLAADPAGAPFARVSSGAPGRAGGGR